MCVQELLHTAARADLGCGAEQAHAADGSVLHQFICVCRSSSIQQQELTLDVELNKRMRLMEKLKAGAGKVCVRKCRAC